MSSPVPTLRPLAVGVVVAVLLLGGAALLPADGPEREPAPATTSDRTGPIRVLRAWDRERAAAWRTGDARALGRLYTPGSRAGRADREMLRAYRARGLRVTGLRMQVASADVRRADDERVVVLVTDRLAATAVATGSGGAHPLPRDRWSRRRVVLVRERERWRVASVTGQPRPSASTASTSSSANR